MADFHMQQTSSFPRGSSTAHAARGDSAASYAPPEHEPRPGARNGPPPARAGDGDGDDFVGDLGRAVQVGGFVARSIWRRRRLVLGVFAAVLGTAVTAAAVLPRSYLVETRILAQRNNVMPLLGNPRRALPEESDTPTRLAAEAVMKRENLEAIVAETHLLDGWPATRSPLHRLKDWTIARLLGPPTRHEQTQALVDLLERRLWVKAGEGTVTIGVLWPGAMQAHQVVLAAQQNFLEERHTSEVAAITESISILEEHARRVHGEIREILDDLGAVRRATLPELPDATRAALTTPRTVSAQVAQAQTRLFSLQRTIGDLEQFRSQRMAELQATLSAQRNSFGPSHPQLIATEERIAALAADSPQLTQLREQEAALRAELRRRGAALAATPAPPPGSLDPLVARAAIANLERARADSVLEERQTYAKSRLKIAVTAYEDLLERLESARIELETTRAAFKYRYGIIKPPQLPRSPLSPRVPLLLVGGFVLAIGLACFLAVAIDLGTGGVLERWQIERVLKLRVLGEVDRA